VYLRVILVGIALAAGTLTGACGATTPVLPTPIPDSGSSRQPSPNPPAPPPISGSCNATNAQWAIGEAASDQLLERARVAAGAGSARFLQPNQPITMEYLASRLNLGLDAHDIVRAVVCG
jgi:hypothetical protein